MDEMRKSESFTSQTLHYLMKNRLAVIGGILVLLVFILSIFAPFIAPYNPSKIDIKYILVGPSFSHPLGTDDLGRDVLSRMLWGGRISLEVGFVAVGIATILGIFLGSIAGYYGGWIDNLIMRAVDIMLSIPTIFLVLAVIAILEPSIINIMIVIGLTSWMEPARLIRAEFISLKEREFVIAARAIGATDVRIIMKHVLPNGSLRSSCRRPWASAELSSSSPP
jgi:peptide/nickel transport system permease protein